MGNIDSANNYAFIDSQNVNLEIKKLGWRLDFTRFRKYLRDKYDVSRAYIFIGFVPGNERLYTALERYGFELVFKPTVIDYDGKVKGNCDAELVLQAMIDYENYDRAVVVTGDGDFYCLIKYLYEKGKLERLLVPNRFRYSSLYKTLSPDRFSFMNQLQVKLEYRKERY